VGEIRFKMGIGGRFGDNPIIVDCDHPQNWLKGRQCNCRELFLLKLTEIVNRELSKEVAGR
jgi:hypothetical protein